MKQGVRTVLIAVLVAVGIVVLAVWTLPWGAPAREPLRVAAPNDAADLLLWLALHDGGFAAVGMAAEVGDAASDEAALAAIRAGEVEVAAASFRSVLADLTRSTGNGATAPVVLAAIAHVTSETPDGPLLEHRVLVGQRSAVANDPERFERILRGLDHALGATRGGTTPLPDAFLASLAADPNDAQRRYQGAIPALDLPFGLLGMAAVNLAPLAEQAPVTDAALQRAIHVFDPRPLSLLASAHPGFPWSLVATSAAEEP